MFDPTEAHRERELVTLEDWRTLGVNDVIARDDGYLWTVMSRAHDVFVLRAEGQFGSSRVPTRPLYLETPEDMVECPERFFLLRPLRSTSAGAPRYD